MAVPRTKRPWLPGDDSSSEEAAAGGAACVRLSTEADFDDARFCADAAAQVAAPAPADASLPLDESNKGFQLLRKAGFTPGRGLGPREDGRAEPLAVTRRAPRSGLGVHEAERERRLKDDEAARAASVARSRREAARRAEFRASASAAAATQVLRRQLRDACAALETLDRAAGVCSSALWAPQADDAEELAAAELEARLNTVCRRLREEYCYCTFCGAQFGLASELARECPGERSADHG